MSEREMTPQERKVQDLVRDLPEERADTAFAAELRAGFVAGTLAGTDEAATAHDAEEPGVLAFPGGRFVIALAAAAVLAGLVMIFNHGPSWTLTGTSGGGSVIVSGAEVDAGDTATLEDLLHAGATVRVTGDAQIDLAVAGRLALQIAPGSDVTVPNAPGRWFGRDMKAEIRHGEIRFVTGPGFPGSRLTIEAPAALIDVLGTTLAVIANPCTTCVCVFDGEVEMAGDDGAFTVPEGMRRTVFTNGRDPVVEAIRPMETMKLQMLQESALPRLQRRR